MTELQTTHGWRFSLRSLLVLMAVVAFAAYSWKFFYYLGVGAQLAAIFWPLFFAVLVCAWNLGQSGPRGLVVQSQPAKWLAVVLLTYVAANVLYLLWVRSRWKYLIWTFKPQLEFPYPDCWLLELHEYLDNMFPAGDGYIKMHGEIDLVHLIVNYATWFIAAFLAFMIGLLFRVDRQKLLRRAGTSLVNYWRSTNKR